MESDYIEIPLLRPPKIKTSYLLKTLFAKFKLFFSSFSTPSIPLFRDHLWDCPKVIFKTTFGQSQRWSYYRGFYCTVSGYISLPFTQRLSLLDIFILKMFGNTNLSIRTLDIRTKFVTTTIWMERFLCTRWCR